MIIKNLILCTTSPQYTDEANATTQNIFFVNSYPWLFPGGVGNIYDLEQGKIPIKEWGRHLLQYYDG
jgi:hypothetical protein